MQAAHFTRYQRIPGLVLGFHGCDKVIGEDLLQGKMTHLKQSANPYDWLGDGIYFWENDPQRAREFAEDGAKKPKLTKGYIKDPFVLGAVIDLGLCLNLSDRKALDELASAHEILCASYDDTGTPRPKNKGENFGARFLDRAVIQMVHEIRELFDHDDPGAFPEYDTVRSAFPEGDFLYDGAGFRAKNHIQIAVRKQACIRGYFRPIPD